MFETVWRETVLKECMLTVPLQNNMFTEKICEEVDNNLVVFEIDIVLIQIRFSTLVLFYCTRVFIVTIS